MLSYLKDYMHIMHFQSFTESFFLNKVVDNWNPIENRCIKGYYHSDVIE